MEVIKEVNPLPTQWNTHRVKSEISRWNREHGLNESRQDRKIMEKNKVEICSHKYRERNSKYKNQIKRRREEGYRAEKTAQSLGQGRNVLSSQSTHCKKKKKRKKGGEVEE